MSSPLRASPSSAPQSYPAGTVLRTSSPAVGVLVEDEQRRLIAIRDIRAGETIFTLVGRETRVATRYSIQVGPEMHLDSDDLATDAERVNDRYWMYLNHSCEPSAWVKGLSIIALKDIASGDGVTFDYNTTEWDMASPFNCGCGTASCVGTVQGYKHLSPAAQARLLGYLAEYLR